MIQDRPNAAQNDARLRHRHYTLAGWPIDILEFLRVNDFTAEQVAAIEALEPGQELVFGGETGTRFRLIRGA